MGAFVKETRTFGKQRIIERWLRIFPQAEVEQLDDAAHSLQEDRPDRIVEGVRKVLNRILPFMA